jgi:hypothetical protein
MSGDQNPKVCYLHDRLRHMGRNERTQLAHWICCIGQSATGRIQGLPACIPLATGWNYNETRLTGKCVSATVARNISHARVRLRVTLQLTVSQSVRLGVEPNLGLLTRDIFFIFFGKLQSCLNWGALSDERSGLSFVSLQSVYSSQSVFTYCVIHI